MAADPLYVSLKDHLLALRAADNNLHARLREADQRALEIKAAGDAEARRIKEEADRDALALDRKTRDYKEEKNNELREQINRERLLYATKEDVQSAANRLEAIINPLVAFVASQQGERGGRQSVQEMFMKNIPGLVLAILSIGAAVIAVAYAVKR